MARKSSKTTRRKPKTSRRRPSREAIENAERLLRAFKRERQVPGPVPEKTLAELLGEPQSRIREKVDLINRCPCIFWEKGLLPPGHYIIKTPRKKGSLVGYDLTDKPNHPHIYHLPRHRGGRGFRCPCAEEKDKSKNLKKIVKKHKNKTVIFKIKKKGGK